jgi:hypothetical protein
MTENVVSRTYNLDALQAAGQPTPRTTLQFGNLSATMRSICVDNGSNCSIGIFLDRDPEAAASFIVPAGWMKTIPISARRVGIAFSTPTGDVPRGSAYLYVTDERMAAASAPTASSSGGSFIWDQTVWDTGGILT